MDKLSRFLVAVAACLLPAGVGSVEQTNGSEAATHSPPWPMQLSVSDHSFVIYPPRFQSWRDDRLQGKAAVSVRAKDSEQLQFGMLTVSARTITDPGTGMVTIDNLTIDDADFPAAGARMAEFTALLQRQIGAQSWQVAQDRLQSDIAIEHSAQQASEQPLRHDAPHIIHTQQPAILIPVDGAPVLRDVPETALMRVINTRALILFDKNAQRHYLHVDGAWMNSRNLEGPWLPSAIVSSELDRAKERVTQQNQVDLLDGDGEGLRISDGAPAIFVSTVPAELLQTDGAPEYSPVGDTRLLYVINSPQSIFFDLESQQHYALISGRWFRSPRLDLPDWFHVPAAQLPADFAMIPPDHPVSDVRTAVAGTVEAREAVIANAIPEIAGIDRAGARLEIAYDGPASFRSIDGTSLQYAVNSPTPVIRASENAFFALDNGVWFVSGSPYGPWEVASHVPSEIYAIPRSSPLHYVTYVRIHGNTPDTVYVGYTPGYVGSYVAADSVVVYGTGWYYRPWIGSVWYGAPVTWGHGFTVSYSWWNPWWSWTPVYRSRVRHYRPWWGPWHAPFSHSHKVVVGAPRNVTVINTVNVTNIYQRWSPKAVAWKGPHLHRPKRAAAPIVRRTPGSGSIRFSDGRVHQFSGSGDARHRNPGSRARERERPSLPPIQTTRPRANAEAFTPGPRSQQAPALRRSDADRRHRTEPRAQQRRNLPSHLSSPSSLPAAPQARTNRRDAATVPLRPRRDTVDRRPAPPSAVVGPQQAPLQARPTPSRAERNRVQRPPAGVAPQRRQRADTPRSLLRQPSAVPNAPAASSPRVAPRPRATAPGPSAPLTKERSLRPRGAGAQPQAGAPRGRRQSGGPPRVPLGGLSR
ncbi:MAG: hypothetical protein WDZ63_06225 [Burkholderiales bacterium]